MTKIVVVDASVFAKLVLDEDDSDEAIAFFAHAKAQGYFLSAPSLFLYELLAVAGPSSRGSESAYTMLCKALSGGFEIVELNEATVRKALEISNAGHPKSGYPTFYDSSYHALAISSGGVFLTSDQRHVAKASGFGSVVLLKDWRTYFQASQPS